MCPGLCGESCHSPGGSGEGSSIPGLGSVPLTLSQISRASGLAGRATALGADRASVSPDVAFHQEPGGGRGLDTCRPGWRVPLTRAQPLGVLLVLLLLLLPPGQLLHLTRRGAQG